MKNLLLLAALVSTITINACPNLAGTYNCIDTDSDGNVTNGSMSISQSGNVFTVTDEEGVQTIKADGSTEVVDEMSIKTFCTADKLIMEVNGTFSDDDGTSYTSSSAASVTKSGVVMTTVFKGKTIYAGKEYPHSSSSVCTEI